ncbi:MAG: DUF58 domain-containing protein [Gammaproteobacteria bacterium HGW-Gammaproteobacteria-14]|nr:MAG: DUF58 domain-containing protein [Gammaproteobacteria bacterium HGW-Gammaproteobacteria-14]
MNWRPTPRLLRLSVALCIIAALSVIVGQIQPGWKAWLAFFWGASAIVLLAVIAADMIMLWRRPTPQATRVLPAAFSVHQQHPVSLQFNNSGLPNWFEIADHHPADDPNTGMPLTIHRQPASITEYVYRYRPSKRGKAHFGDIELWLPGPLALMLRRYRIAQESTIPVYPDFSMLNKQPNNINSENRLDGGKRQQPRRGEGMEFHQLREYRSGDPLRQIDWNASARRRSLISRDYQEEQNQHLIILLDGGARLAMQSDDISGFDHGLNAALLLAWSALKQGDRPGIQLFSHDTECWLPPSRGRAGLNRMLNTLYSIHPSDHASDYSDAARQLLRRWNKHSLVILITHLQPDDEQEILTSVRLLGARHRLMIADIQLPDQARLRHSTVDSPETALRIAADAGWQQDRDKLHARLRHAGAIVVQATPEHLPERLNKTYLALKRSGQL